VAVSPATVALALAFVFGACGGDGPPEEVDSGPETTFRFGKDTAGGGKTGGADVLIDTAGGDDDAPDAPLDDLGSAPDDVDDGLDDAHEAGLTDVASETADEFLVILDAPADLTVGKATWVGATVKTGTGVAVDGLFGSVLVWKPGSSGSLAVLPSNSKLGAYVVALRPGSVTLVGSYQGSSSLEASMDAALPVGTCTASVEAAVGATQAEVNAGLVGGILAVKGESEGTEGLKLEVAFPASAKAGDVFVYGAPDTPVGTKVSASFAALAGTKYSLLDGVITIDFNTNGRYRGTFSGVTEGNKLLAGAFDAYVSADLGVTPLDEAPIVIEKSASLDEVSSGTHASRASLHVLDPAEPAWIGWRRISQGTKHAFMLGRLDAATGALVGTPVAVVSSLAHVADSDFGRIEGTLLVVWEGKGSNVVSENNRLWGRIADADGMSSDDPFVISEDACGDPGVACEPKVLPIDPTHFLVVWTRPGGGLGAQLVDLGGTLPGDPTTVALGANTPVLSRGASSAMLGYVLPGLGPRALFVSSLGSAVKTGVPIEFGVSEASPGAPALAAVDAFNSWVVGWPVELTESIEWRRIKAGTGAKIGDADTVISAVTGARLVAASSGKQVLFVWGLVAGTPAGSALMGAKVAFTTDADLGTKVGSDTVVAKAFDPIDAAQPSLAWHGGAKAFVCVWSGGSKSGGVYALRLK